MVVTLKTGSSMAKVDTKGAELVSLQDVFGTEYIWQKDPKFWARSSPLLFPIVGGLRDGKTTIQGREYAIPGHGFLRDAEFRLTYQAEDTAVFTTSATEETLAIYPYPFSLSLAYKLSETGISVRYTVLNMGEGPMDFLIGAHPAFNTPVGGGAFEDCYLEFDAPEPDGCPRFDLEKGQFNMDMRIDYTGGGNRVDLKYRHFDHDALWFDQPHSHVVRLKSAKTGRGVEVDFETFDTVAFWTPIGKEAPFLCIEPWNGMAPCSDEGNEYEKKRCVRHLDGNGQAEFRMKITMI